MKKVLALFGAAVAVVVVVLLVVIQSRPDDFRVSRSAVIPAPPPAVFAHVNDLQKWESWSPWAKRDPNSRVSFSGPPEGKGSAMAWVGNEQVGEGKMTITESVPGERIVLQLEFVKPFEGSSTTEFTFRPEDGGTHVTWTMSGTNNFVSKAVSLFMDCDKIVGAQFEQGLDNIKKAVAAQP